MNGLRRYWAWLLASSALLACTTTPPSVAEVDGCETRGAAAQFEKVCAGSGVLLALHTGDQLGIYHCVDIVGYLEAGPVVLTRGGALTLPGASGAARRYWGSAQESPWNARPVFVIPWGSRPPLLPSQTQLLRNQEALRHRQYEKHHIYPQAFKQWFRIRGIDIDEFTLPMEVEEHRRIHRGERGGPWNDAWRKYIEAHPNAKKIEIERHAGQLIYEFNLFGIVLPYRRPLTLQHPSSGGN